MDELSLSSLLCSSSLRVATRPGPLLFHGVPGEELFKRTVTWVEFPGRSPITSSFEDGG